MIAHGSNGTSHHVSFDDEFGQMSDGKDGESAADVKNSH